MAKFVYKITKDRRITIPPAIEELLGIEDGDIVSIDIEMQQSKVNRVMNAKMHIDLMKNFIKQMREDGTFEDFNKVVDDRSLVAFLEKLGVNKQ